jgi:hypothetical protein
MKARLKGLKGKRRATLSLRALISLFLLHAPLRYLPRCYLQLRRSSQWSAPARWRRDGRRGTRRPSYLITLNKASSPVSLRIPSGLTLSSRNTDAHGLPDGTATFPFVPQKFFSSIRYCRTNRACTVLYHIFPSCHSLLSSAFFNF